MEANLSNFISLAKRFLRPEDVHTIFELGARDCEETLDFHWAFPQARIYTFECNPRTLPQCREAVDGIGKIELVEKAVSDVCGKVSFYPTNPTKTITTWPDGNPGASSLLKASGKYPVEEYVQDEIQVESVTLEAFLTQRLIDEVDLMWMDIQGAELMALRGAGKRLRDVHIIHLEGEFFEIYRGQPLFPEVEAFLRRSGFVLVGFTYRDTYAGDAVFVNCRFLRAPDRARRLLVDRALYLAQRFDARNRVLWAPRKMRSVGIRLRRWLGMLLRRDWAGLQHALCVDYLRFVKPHPLLDTPSDVKVDVMIVAHEKDLDPLPFTISAVRRFLLHPIGKVYIVAADSPRFRQFCRDQQCEFVDEDRSLRITKKCIHYVDRTGADRSGWLFQQLLKLNGDTIATEEHFYVIDADTVLIRPCAMKRRARTVLFWTDVEYHRPYYEAFRKLLRNNSRFPVSFVCHQMLFEKSKLRHLKSLIERAAEKPWYEAIPDAVDTSEPSCFGEWEMYGNFLAANYPHEIDVQYFSNIPLPVRELKRLKQLEQTLSSRYQSISFHAYLS